jgi:hypothetical protein
MTHNQAQELLREVLYNFSRSGYTSEELSKMFHAELSDGAVRLALIQNGENKP